MGDKNKTPNPRNGNGNHGMTKDKGNVTPTSALICAMGSVHSLLFKTLHTHWNAKGSRFLAVHEFTEKQYIALLQERSGQPPSWERGSSRTTTPTRPSTRPTGSRRT